MTTRFKYELIGHTNFNLVVGQKSNNLDDLRKFGAKLKHFAIYHTMRGGHRFHNSSDTYFLVEHHNVPYFINKGIPSYAETI